MPNNDPAVGEVWYAGSQEGLITARGDHQVRLVSRVGRRVSYPLNSFTTMWNLRSLIPREPQGCFTCEEEAFLRFRDEEDIRWVCERHAPQGSVLFFPEDNTERETPIQIHCPQCESLSVTDFEARTTRDAAYQRRSCNSCGSSWFSLDISRIPQIVLFTDLPRLADVFNEVTHNVTFTCGFRAERTIARSLGTNPYHFQGIPVRSNRGISSETIIVLAVPRSLEGSGPRDPLSDPLIDPTTLEIPEDIRERLEAQADGMGSVTEEADPLPGTFWRRKRSDNKVLLAEVRGFNEEGYVEYEIILNPSNIRLGSSWDTRSNPPMLMDQFKEHWSFVHRVEDIGRLAYVVPQRNSFWKDVVSGQVIRIQEVSQDVVRFYRHEDPNPILSEGLTNFIRLYKELVYPPGDTLWVRNSRVYEVLSWEGEGDYEEVRVNIRPLDGEGMAVPLLDLFSRYDAMSFYVSARGASFRNPIYQKASWSRQGKEIVIHDVGWVDSVEYVRFTGVGVDIREAFGSDFENVYERDGATICVLPVSRFENLFEPVWPEAPCEEGDIWLLKEDEDRSYKVTLVNRPEMSVEMVPANHLTILPTRISFDRLLQDYRKMEIMTLWDHLD